MQEKLKSFVNQQSQPDSTQMSRDEILLEILDTRSRHFYDKRSGWKSYSKSASSSRSADQ